MRGSGCRRVSAPCSCCSGLGEVLGNHPISKQQQLEMTPSSWFTCTLQGTSQPVPCCLGRRQQTFCHQSLGGNCTAEAGSWFPNRSPKCQTAGAATFCRALECLEMFWEQQSPSRVGVHLPNDHFAKTRMGITGIFLPGGGEKAETCDSAFQPFHRKRLWDTSGMISHLKTTPGKGVGGGEEPSQVISFSIATRFWLKIKLNLQP